MSDTESRNSTHIGHIEVQFREITLYCGAQHLKSKSHIQQSPTMILVMIFQRKTLGGHSQYRQNKMHIFFLYYCADARTRCTQIDNITQAVWVCKRIGGVEWLAEGMTHIFLESCKRERSIEKIMMEWNLKYISKTLQLRLKPRRSSVRYSANVYL